MSTIDRLEGLAQRSTVHVLSNAEGQFLLDALPDLLKLARAAWRLGWNDRGGNCWCPEADEDERRLYPHTTECVTLRNTLEPLFREVPS